MNDALHQLLKNRHVWRGTEQAESSDWQGLASGYPRLDRHLPGGGWPQQALTEILLEHYGSGELKLLMPALAHLSRVDSQIDGRINDYDDNRRANSTNSAAGWIAWIAPPFDPYPPALAQWGIDLSRVLIVRPKNASESLWAAEQALASGNCAAVLLWSDTLDDGASRRLQLAAEKGQSWAIAFRSLRALSEASAAALRIKVTAGTNGTDLGILKNRGGRPAVIHDYAAALDQYLV